MRSQPTSERVAFRKVVRFRAEDDSPAAIRAAARRRRMLPSEYLRQIVRDRISHDGIELGLSLFSNGERA
jgi:hypothetical protein